MPKYVSGKAAADTDMQIQQQGRTHGRTIAGRCAQRHPAIWRTIVLDSSRRLMQSHSRGAMTVS